MAIRRTPLALGIVASIAVGCSLLTSIPDVTSGAAGADGGDASPTSDAPQADGSASFCAAQTTPAAFCDDFDDETDLLAPGRWDFIQPGGIARIDGVEFRSAPHALFSGPPAPGACKYSIVQKQWAGPFRASRLGFSVHTDSGGPALAVALQSLTIANTTCQVVFVPDPSGSQIFEQILPPSGQVLNTNHYLPALTDGAWHDITVDYDPDGKITVTADGSQVSDPVGQTCPPGRGSMAVELGWHCVNNAPTTLSVHLDNVTFTPR